MKKNYLALVAIILLVSGTAFYMVSCNGKSPVTLVPGTSTGSITWKGSTSNLGGQCATATTCPSGSGTSSYILQGPAVGNNGYPTLAITLCGSKPTSNSTYSIPTNKNMEVIVTDNGNTDWKAKSGTVNISVSGSQVTATFSNLVFYNEADTTSKTTANANITCY